MSKRKLLSWVNNNNPPMQRNTLIFLIIACFLIVIAAGCTNSAGSSAAVSTMTASPTATSDPRSAIIKMAYSGDSIVTADVTNIGSRAQSFVLEVNFYDGSVKVDTQLVTTPTLNPGETGRVKIYRPSDANKYSLDNVATTIGDKYYRVYYDVSYS